MRDPTAVDRIDSAQRAGDVAGQLPHGQLADVVLHGEGGHGYTVERAIHGETAPYNDIAGWNWTQVPATLGVANHLAFRAQTYGELDDALTAAAENQDRMVFVEVVLPRLEIPPLLAQLVGNMHPTPRS